MMVRIPPSVCYLYGFGCHARQRHDDAELPLGLEHVDRRLPARRPGAFAGRLEELPMELLGLVEQSASLSPHQISGITRHTSLNELPKVDLSRPAHRLKTTRSNGPEKSREAQKVVKGRYILVRCAAPARAGEPALARRRAIADGLAAIKRPKLILARKEGKRANRHCLRRCGDALPAGKAK